MTYAADRKRTRRHLSRMVGRSRKEVLSGRNPRLHGMHGNTRGDINEKRALSTLKKIIDDLSPEARRAIIDFWQVAKNSPHDHFGWDIIIETDFGLVGFQVKSSASSRRRFLKTARYQGIPCVVINDKTSCAEWHKQVSQAFIACLLELIERKKGRQT